MLIPPYGQGMEIRQGQRWRSVQEGDPQIFEVESVGGDSILGTQQPEDASSSAPRPRTWSRKSFEFMALLSDLDWQNHRVVCRVTDNTSQHLREALQYVGQIDEFTWIDLPDGSPSPAVILSVVAATPKEALRRVENAATHVGDQVEDIYLG